MKQYVIAGLKPCGCIEIAAWNKSMLKDEIAKFKRELRKRGLAIVHIYKDKIKTSLWSCEKCANY